MPMTTDRRLTPDSGLRTSDLRPTFSSHLTLRPIHQPANIGMVHGDDNQRAARRAKTIGRGGCFMKYTSSGNAAVATIEPREM